MTVLYRDCTVLVLNSFMLTCILSRRGNPLHLCKDSYRHLEKLWMSHSIPETIAHQLESNTTLQTIDWQHL